MRIGIFGLGYVGLTTGACLLRRGYEVIGYEISKVKRDQLANGLVPLSEPGVESALLKGISEGRFTVSSEVGEQDIPDIFFICVGTPSDDRGGTNLSAVDSVFASLAQSVGALQERGSEIVLRSTVPPGTLQAFSSKYPRLFCVTPIVFYPEFLREGTAMRDFENPPQTVIGSIASQPSPSKIIKVFETMGFEYERVNAISAESLKFACNAYHALKVCFANEVGRLVSSYGGDAHEVMRLFVRDKELNISSKYLRPGAPFGGSCLPKDTRSIRNMSVSRGLQMFTITSCEESNQAHYSYLINKIVSYAPRRLAILGLAFKKDTDDIRESPTVELLYRLASLGGIELKVHDYLVQRESAIGVNERLLEKLVTLPAITFSSDPEEVIDGVDAIVVMHSDKRYERLIRDATQPVFNVATWSGLLSSGVTPISYASLRAERLTSGLLNASIETVLTKSMAR